MPPGVINLPPLERAGTRHSLDITKKPSRRRCPRSIKALDSHYAAQNFHRRIRFDAQDTPFIFLAKEDISRDFDILSLKNQNLSGRLSLPARLGSYRIFPICSQNCRNQARRPVHASEDPDTNVVVSLTLEALDPEPARDLAKSLEESRSVRKLRFGSRFSRAGTLILALRRAGI